MDDFLSAYDEVISDDGALVLDRLVRGLHRNDDGHLAINEKAHKKSVEENHNAACLYIYTKDAGLYTLNTYYVYGGDNPNTYEEWREIVNTEIDSLNKQAGPNWHGVYGWNTTTIRITPMRTGDLFVAIDADGARGVRLAFNTRKDKREAH